MVSLKSNHGIIIRAIAILIVSAMLITSVAPFTAFAEITEDAKGQNAETEEIASNADSLAVDITQSKVTVAWKDQLTLKLRDGSASDVIWTSSKPSVAKVSQDGTVTGIHPGSTSITCMCRADNTVCDKCSVKVKVKAVYLAHKGYSAKAPENTLPAIKKAVKAGFTGVEIDIFESKKEKSKKYKPFILVCHDKSLKKLTGKKGNITKLKHSNYKKYRIKKHVHGKKKYGAQKIPTLKQAMNAAWKAADKKGKKNFIIELDIKQKNISKAAVRSIITLAGDRKVRINSPHFRAIKKFKKYRKSPNTELWVYRNSKSKKKTWKFLKKQQDSKSTEYRCRRDAGQKR